MTESSKTLHKKLVKVLGSLGTVNKSGKNKAQGYTYATESDLLDAIRAQLIEQNVFIFTSSEVQDIKELNKKDREGNDKLSFITTVSTQHTFYDADSGESHTVTSSGQGHDSLDKGVFKAITGANKYFLMKNFLMATGDDPENDSGSTTNKGGYSKPKAASGGDKSNANAGGFGTKKGKTATKTKPSGGFASSDKPKDEPEAEELPKAATSEAKPSFGGQKTQASIPVEPEEKVGF